MHTLSWRTFGFAIPTVTLVTALHLAREASPGEALDGVVSGLYFTTVFLVGAILSLFGGFLLHREPAEPRDARARRVETFAGAATAVGTWLVLYAWWMLPGTRELRADGARVFAIHSVAMAGAAIVLAMLRDRVAPERSPAL